MRLRPLWSATVGLVWLTTPLASQTVPGTPRRAEIAPTSLSAPALPSSSATGFLQGVALDSIHGGRLIDAKVQLEGTDRVGVTDSLGVFMLEGITPGSYRVLVDHPLLDTLGIALATQPLTFSANQVTLAVVAVPSGGNLASRLCAAGSRQLGPGAMVGRVREADGDLPARGALLTMTWFDAIPKRLSASVAALMKQVPRVRETTAGEDGRYRLCGLPEEFDGTLRVQWERGGSAAEVPVRQEGGVLTLRSVSATGRAAVSDSVKEQPARRGSASLRGRVTNKAGLPVASARVGLVGQRASTLTRENGEFTLDALPVGIQTVSVRRLGYAPAEASVSLSESAPARVTVIMGAFVPELPAVEVVSRRDAGLEKLGFLRRKREGMGGHFLTPEQIEARRATRVTELFSTVPTLRASGGPRGRLVSKGRLSGWGGCVAVTVDRLSWGDLGPGDIDSFFHPEEVAAIEVYEASQAPIEFSVFSTAGEHCSVVVVWTKAYVLGKRYGF